MSEMKQILVSGINYITNTSYLLVLQKKILRDDQIRFVCTVVFYILFVMHCSL